MMWRWAMQRESCGSMTCVIQKFQCSGCRAIQAMLFPVFSGHVKALKQTHGAGQQRPQPVRANRLGPAAQAPATGPMVVWISPLHSPAPAPRPPSSVSTHHLRSPLVRIIAHAVARNGLHSLSLIPVRTSCAAHDKGAGCTVKGKRGSASTGRRVRVSQHTYPHVRPSSRPCVQEHALRSCQSALLLLHPASASLRHRRMAQAHRGVTQGRSHSVQMSRLPCWQTLLPTRSCVARPMRVTGRARLRLP
jgi:hypothetical protein